MQGNAGLILTSRTGQNYSARNNRFHNNGGTFKKTGAGEAVIEGDFYNNGGELQIESGSLRLAGSFGQQAGFTKLVNGDLIFARNANFSGGSLVGTGTITGNVSNTGATVRPGNSPGTLTINGNYTHGSDARLVIEIAGLADGEFDVLDITGTATLNGGTLEVILLPGDYDIPMLTDFDVLRAGTLIGSFSEFILPTDEFGVPLFAATPDPLTGDFTLTALQDITAVPEPTAALLLACGSLVLLRRHSRRHAA